MKMNYSQTKTSWPLQQNLDLILITFEIRLFNYVIAPYSSVFWYWHVENLVVVTRLAGTMRHYIRAKH